ncbi:MAG: DUF192 domain-containing protein [Thiobacillus sp.]
MLALLLLGSAACTAEYGAHVPLRIGVHVFQVDVATTPQQRERGLMGRTRLAGDAGMLFVFEQKGSYCFWMKNTLIPLSIAFLADDGTIVNIEAMQPQTLDRHCPRTPIRYAVEVPQGAFQNKGIQAGMRVSGGPFGSRS